MMGEVYMGGMRVTKRQWVVLALFGLFGQIAWMVENMYFNVFLYKTTTGGVQDIAIMVAASAIIATLATLFMGALSDRKGRRRILISVCYLLWGITTMAFSVINTANLQRFIPAAQVMTVAVILIIVMDCIMTFFGATANDAAFNSWVTDITDPSNRGAVEGMLSAMPLVALLIIFGLFDGLTKQGKWQVFFLLVGGLTSVVGLVGFFLIQDVPGLAKSNLNPLVNLARTFRPSMIKQNKNLYLTFTALSLAGISLQTYMPYFIIYIEQWLGIKNYAVLLGMVFVFSAVGSVLTGRLADKIGRGRMIFPALVLYLIGLIGLYFTRNLVPVIIWGIVMMTGNLTILMNLNSRVRDLTPPGQVGLFQGIRMMFTVLVPMTCGPFIGSIVTAGSPLMYEEFGVSKSVPTPMLFLAAAVSGVLIFLPVLLGRERTVRKGGA
ncbi:major facilitator superfamily MFS_1 [Parasphaerochaeta coccoides DSM 17374]|uniref:Major facilitator superfamily MFS_1 n=2 Tax=Parasphaerochaeta TaxID=3062336 RepID=F4GL62_PARC1|nr:major facilitator superfamily MFS_1 [Parasphaerochaeta coccoides DSM 17374]